MKYLILFLLFCGCAETRTTFVNCREDKIQETVERETRKNVKIIKITHQEHDLYEVEYIY